jgi:hypothetical protein
MRELAMKTFLNNHQLDNDRIDATLEISGFYAAPGRFPVPVWAIPAEAEILGAISYHPAYS